MEGVPRREQRLLVAGAQQAVDIGVGGQVSAIVGREIGTVSLIGHATSLLDQRQVVLSIGKIP